MGWGRRRKFGNPDRNQGPIVDQARDIGATVEITTGVGGGFPDLVVGFQGITVLTEVKRPGTGVVAKRLRDSQEAFRAKWRGGPVLDVDNGMDLVQGLISLDTRTPPARPTAAAGKFRLTYPGGRQIEADSLADMMALIRASQPF